MKLKNTAIIYLSLMLSATSLFQAGSVYAETQHIEYYNGDVYDGEVAKDDEDISTVEYYKHGQGVYTKANGTKIKGKWVDNYLTGKATVIYKDKEKFVGNFKQDIRSGKGKYYFKNGDVYNGSWKSDLMHGKGTYKFKNKSTISGTWKKGKLQGKCTFKTKKCIYMVGMKNGKLMKIYSSKRR